MIKMEIESIRLEDLRPYDNNPRLNEAAVDGVAVSIREFGFKVPIVVDRDNVIVCGHTRYLASKQLGLESVPCIRADDLSDDQIKAFRLADNKVAEVAQWDLDKLQIELDDIEMDMSDFGFEMERVDFFDKEYHGGNERQEGNDEYNEFLDKFEQPKTTDDCYTPGKVYDAVADWVASEYGVDRAKFVRPFYPGGDYQNEKYKKDEIVVDNPPFSILSEIIKFYTEKGVRYFLFAPALTLFSSSSSSSSSCAVCVGYGVIYENKANVNTSFVTNLEDARFRTAPTLYKAMDKAMQEVLAETRVEIPKYSYPTEVVLSTQMSYLSKYGLDFKVSRAESCHIRCLDAQKEFDKAMFGSGYLISEKAAAEKAAAEKAAAEKAAATVWSLSDREREIIKKLG